MELSRSAVKHRRGSSEHIHLMAAIQLRQTTLRSKSSGRIFGAPARRSSSRPFVDSDYCSYLSPLSSSSRATCRGKNFSREAPSRTDGQRLGARG